jgi:hypothetical protein
VAQFYSAVDKPPRFEAIGKALRSFGPNPTTAENAKGFPLAFSPRPAIFTPRRLPGGKDMKPLTLIQILALTLLAVVGAQASSGIASSAPAAIASEIQTDL